MVWQFEKVLAGGRSLDMMVMVTMRISNGMTGRVVFKLIISVLHKGRVKVFLLIRSITVLARNGVSLERGICLLFAH